MASGQRTPVHPGSPRGDDCQARARGVPAQAFIEFAKEHIDQLVQEIFERTSPQPGLPGYREAADGKTRLALQMIDAGANITEPVCLRTWNDRPSMACASGAEVHCMSEP